jgi:hypothetical protein
MLIWSHGLPEFLSHSNEDIVCASFIGKLIARLVQSRWRDCTDFVRVADVGCGSGSKAVQIARHLRGHGVRSAWELIDIDCQWKSMLEANIASERNSNHNRFEMLCPVAAQCWVESATFQPHVAQFIHVPYDDDSEEMIYEVASKLLTRRCFILISAEHPHSDLNVIRRRLNSFGLDGLPSQRTTSLADRFKKCDFLVKEYVLRDKYLDIGPRHQNKDIGWLCDLVFGSRRSVQDNARAAEVIDKFSFSREIASLNSRVLNIPDLLITVRQRG